MRSTRELLFLVACVVAAFLVRILIVSNHPQFITGGDSGIYATLTKELINSNFIPPAKNSLEYPSSPFIYSPILLEIFGMIYYAVSRLPISSVQADPLLIFHIQLFFSILVSSLTTIPLYYLIKRMFDSSTAAAIGALFWIIFIPALYFLAWSAYTSIWGMFLLVILLALLVGEISNLKTALIIGGLFALIGLSHDLDGLVAGLILVAYAVLLYSREASRAKSKRVILSIITGLAGISLWYIPKASYFLALPKVASSTGPSNITSIIAAIQAAWDPLLEWGVFLVLGSTLMIFVGRFIIRNGLLPKDQEGRDFAYVLFFVPIVIILFSIGDIVVLARLQYYVYLSALILCPGALSYIAVRIGNLSTMKRHLRFKKPLVGLVLVFMICLLAAISFPAILTSAQEAHTWYANDAPNDHIVDLPALVWMKTHFDPGLTVVAEGWETGTWISSFVNDPVLIAQPPQYLSQTSEIAESNAAFQIIQYPDSQSALNYMSSYNVSYIVVPSKSSDANLTALTLSFSQLYNDGSVAIFGRYGTISPVTGLLRVSLADPVDTRFYANSTFVGEWGVNWVPLEIGSYYLSEQPVSNSSTVANTDANVTIITPSVSISFTVDLETTPIPIMGNATTVVSIGSVPNSTVA